MISITGNRLYGKVDEVPGGLFHVATEFQHFCFVPVIPLKSQVILEKTGNQWRGVSVGYCWKSIVLAWFQAALLIKGSLATTLGIATLSTSASGAAALIVGLAMLGLCAATFRVSFLRRASLERAMTLVEKINGGPDMVAAIEAAYANEGNPLAADAQSPTRLALPEAEPPPEFLPDATGPQFSRPGIDIKTKKRSTKLNT